MKLADFDYTLPKDLIAQHPLEKRDSSKLMVLDRKNDLVSHKEFSSIIDYMNKGDLLVLNDTKVIMARLFGKRKTGGKVEVLLLEKLSDKLFKALINPLGKLKTGEEVTINNNGLRFRVVEPKNRIIEFNSDRVWDMLEHIGHVPLPQYIKREDTSLDRETYQTVYAEKDGAVAAPTAGLHFTKALLDKIKNKGINICFVTLHVGYGTFSSIKEDNLALHKMESEYFEIPKGTIELIRSTKNTKGRVFAVGTTTSRALESSHDVVLSKNSTAEDIKGTTDLFIYPPYEFKVVDSLITNFHLPKSTLYILASAFVGMDLIKKAYKEATDNRYRFFSYGDAMLIL